MTKLFLNSRKEEFLRLFEASGWTQAELARQLGLTRGGVHSLIQGDTIPSEVTVRLLRFVLMHEAPEALGKALPQQIGAEGHMVVEQGVAYLADGEQELLNEIRRSEDDHRAELIRALLGVARLVPKKEVTYRKTSRPKQT